MGEEPVLDTRLFLTHFFSGSEDVLQKTRRLLSSLRDRGVVPTVVLSEVFDQVCRRRGMAEARIRIESIKGFGLTTIELTSEIALEAGRLRCEYRGLPLADSIIAATALMKGSKTVISDDPHFEQIREIDVEWF